MRTFAALLSIALLNAWVARAADEPVATEADNDNEAVSAGDAARTSDDTATATEDTVNFDGQTLVLRWEGENPGETIKEYIPADQKLDSWTKLASIRTYAELDDPAALAGAVIKQLKNDYPDSPCAIIENPETGEVVIDFVLWPADLSFVEFNVFKYAKGEDGGVIAEQYALRDYDDSEGFLKGLRPVRERLVNLMTKGLGTGPAVVAAEATETVKTSDADGGSEAKQSNADNTDNANANESPDEATD